MTGDGKPAPLLDALVLHVFHDRLTAPNIDAGIELLTARAACQASAEEWRTAVADALEAGYLHDPIRLPEGALQCHWHLELTPLGVEQARLLRQGRAAAACHSGTSSRTDTGQ